MEKNLSNLYDSLQKLTGLHRQLLEIVRLERTALIDADLKSIHAVTAKKQSLIESVQQEENRRLKFVGEISMDWKRSIKDLTLPNIVIEIQAKDPKGAEQLRSIFNALSVLIQRISDQNASNRILIERSLEHICEMKRNVLGEATVNSDTYTQKGSKTSGTPASRLFLGEA